MTDEERFAVVLDELGGVVVELRSIGLNEDVVLIGAQVVALEQQQRSAKLFELQTAHGLRLNRAFSFEPDLAIDSDDEAKLAEIPDALRRRGFKRQFRAGRPATWSKTVGEVTVEIDLFTTAPEAAHTLVALRGAPRLRSRAITLPDGTSIRLPDAASFLSMKIEAKQKIRPEKTKDSFDLYAYVTTIGAEEISRQLTPRLRESLFELFGDVAAPGVRDVVEAGLPYGTEDERALLARSVVDLFETALRT